MFKFLARTLRAYFIAGVLVLVPVFVSLQVFLWLFTYLDSILQPVLSRFFPVYVVGLGILLMFCVILVVGMVTRNYFGRKLVWVVELLFNRLPFIRVIYTAVQQLLEPFATEKGFSLKHVVLIEYPMKDRLCLGFLAKDDIGVKDGERLMSVFVPANHVYLGYMVILPESHVTRLAMSVEDALKIIVSCGIVFPEPLRLDSATVRPVATSPTAASTESRGGETK